MDSEALFVLCAAFGLGSWSRSSPAPAPAVVFCDCPSAANWFLAGAGVGATVAVALICAGAALLHPRAAPLVPVLDGPDEVFEDAQEHLYPPAAAYRRRP